MGDAATRSIPHAPSGASGASTLASKASDTARTSTTTLADDPHLTLSVEAGKTYRVSATIFATAPNTTPDLQFGFSAPAGSAMFWSFVIDKTTGTGEGQLLTLADSSGRVNLDTATYASVVEGVVTVGETAGDFKVQWAQFSSQADATTVKEGSYLSLTEVTTETP